MNNILAVGQVHISKQSVAFPERSIPWPWPDDSVCLRASSLSVLYGVMGLDITFLVLSLSTLNHACACHCTRLCQFKFSALFTELGNSLPDFGT